MDGSLEVSVVVSSWYIILKLFWRTLENDFIKGPLLHTIHQAFYKNFVILLFWNKRSSFVPIFIMIDWKFGLIQGILILYFYLMWNYTGNLSQFRKFVKMTSQIKYKNWHNLGSTFEVLGGVQYHFKYFYLLHFCSSLFEKINLIWHSLV